jgi:hypothetical protein
VCTVVSRQTRSVEVADIFSQQGEAYIAQHGVSSIQHKAIHAISRCRTSELGGHMLCCNHCGALEIAYNSCRYRHCPKCQTSKKVRWLEERKSELLPVPYFHVVFTIPHELNPIASYNQAKLYNLLFKAAWATVDTLGRDKNRLNGRMGMVAFLHTWNQTLNQHIHLHCMVPAGALCDAGGQLQWNASKSDYLFPVQVMKKLFGKIFLTELAKAFANNELQLKGCITELAKPLNFMKLIAQLRKKTWNVYAKEPFNGAAGGMEYLARYFTKTAIGNERLISFNEHEVVFKYRDSSDNKKTKTMKLAAHEFIRRYLSHILPHGFMRARYFGFLASSVKTKNIALIRSLLLIDEQQSLTNCLIGNTPKITEDASTENRLGAFFKIDINSQEPITPNQPTVPLLNIPDMMNLMGSEKTIKVESTAELMKRVLGIDIEICKHCKIGRLIKIQTIQPSRLNSPIPWDTS